MEQTLRNGHLKAKAISRKMLCLSSIAVVEAEPRLPQRGDALLTSRFISSIVKPEACYASCSIGTKPEHDLPAKLKAISTAGFNAIELSLPDLLSFANSYLEKEVSN
jgi:hypothetical protein